MRYSGNACYIYVLLDTRTVESDYGNGIAFLFTPFYVGKGVKARYRDHLNGKTSQENSEIVNAIRKAHKEPAVCFYRSNLTEDEAYLLERKLIRIIGRRDLGAGPLTNKTEGGEGCSGRVWTEDQRQLRSIISHRAWASKSKKEQRVIVQKRTQSIQRLWDTLPEEDREMRGEAISLGRKAMTEEAKSLHRARLKEAHSKRSRAAELKRIEKLRDANLNRDPKLERERLAKIRETREARLAPYQRKPDYPEPRVSKQGTFVYLNGSWVSFRRVWEVYGSIAYGTARSRLARGWDAVCAVMVPVDPLQDPSTTSSKATKAHALGIPVMTPMEFRKKFKL